jgi:hypothetical protein
MKNSVKSLLVAAAVTGLLGAAVIPAAAEDPKPATTQTDKDKAAADSKDAKAKKASTKDKKAASKDAKDKNSCKSANGCSSKEEKKN